MRRRIAPRPGRGSPRPLAIALALAGLAPALAWPAAADAQVDGDDTFRYEAPQASSQLRAGGLVGLYLGLQLTSYSLSKRPPDPIYDAVYTPWDKLAHGAVSFDSNTFRTNFIGHPTMGTIMYLMARGSRLPTWQASLWTIAGSTTWELVEFHERASVNDLIVTPMVGIAMGEPLLQLGAHLDRTPRTTGRNVLAWLVSPFKKLSDLYDGATPARGPPDDWLVTWAQAGAQATGTGGATAGQVRLGGGWRLVRDAAYGAPGRETRRWLDGQVTAMALGAAVDAHGLHDGRFESSVLLASLYARDVDELRRGRDLVAGLGVGFEVRTHRWTAGAVNDVAGFVEVPRAVLEGRWLRDGLELTGRLGGALLFAGARSYALDGDPAAVPFDELPTGQQQFGYHFGVGGGVHPLVRAAAGPFSLAASCRAEWLPWTAQRPDPRPGHVPTADLEERWEEAQARLAWRAGSGLELGADATWRQRWSRAGDTTRTASDRTLGLTVGWVSDPY